MFEGQDVIDKQALGFEKQIHADPNIGEDPTKQEVTHTENETVDIERKS